MAQPVNFVSDFRSAVTAMLNSYQNAYALVNKADALGWTESTFEGLVGTDITAADFYDAVNEVRSLMTADASSSMVLVKLVT